MGKLNKDNNGFGGVELLLVIVIIVLLGVVGWYVYNHNKTNTKRVGSSSAKISDTWTGMGLNSNWSNANNWSNGVPKNNYNLIFDVAKLTSELNTIYSSTLTSQAPGTGNVIVSTLNNDIANLDLHNISFILSSNLTANQAKEATMAIGLYAINGNGISVSSGINNESGYSNLIDVPISLTGNQTFGANSKSNTLYLGDLDISSHDLKLQVTTNFGNYNAQGVMDGEDSTGAITGSGTIEMTSLNQATYNTSTYSPAFSGQLIIDNGAFLGWTPDHTEVNSSPIGTATITIDSGGQLYFEVPSIGSDGTLTLPNSFNVVGQGIYKSFNTYGAILISPITNMSVNFTGKFILNGNTTINTTTSPGEYSIGIDFSKGDLVKNNYNITTPSNSGITIKQ